MIIDNEYGLMRSLLQYVTAGTTLDKQLLCYFRKMGVGLVLSFFLSLSLSFLVRKPVHSVLKDFIFG